MSINLLPPAYKPKAILTPRGLAKALLIGGIVFVLAFVAYSYFYFRSSLAKEITSLEGSISNASVMITRIEEYEKRFSAAKEVQRVAEELGKSKQLWSEILADIAATLEKDTYFLDVSKDEDSITIRGEASKIDSPARYAEKLHGLHWFESVVLNHSTFIGQSSGEGALTISKDAEFMITGTLKERFRLNREIDIQYGDSNRMEEEYTDFETEGLEFE